MGSVQHWLKAGLLAGSALTIAACSTYPTEPRYSTRVTAPGQSGYGTPQSQQQAAQQQASRNPYYQPPVQQGGQLPTQQPVQQPYQPPVEQPPVYQGPTAPAGSIEGGGLPPAGGPAYPSTSSPVVVTPQNPNAGVPVVAGAAYVIQQGDTISGVGRRFGTPVQTLIDLNNLGPRGSITAGQRIVLPSTAVDRGVDPYATGPAPSGVAPAAAGATPVAPPSGNAPLPPARQPAATSAPAAPTRVSPAPAAQPSATAQAVGQALALQWPVRGEILRRFGPMGMGERNNGINIGAAAGAEVKASADGTVAYVGDDIVGQGLTVLIVHRDGWRTVYSHLGSATVRDGAQVRAGQGIGTVGLTAGDGRPSIHYEVRQMRGDDPVALDPLTLLPR